ncbi:MAG: NAD-dependent DNA ligase LigA [Candidatus Caenarcaniphilales bacterium]|nr:NAD-dependent DNA ligase LigA [Candidatus Caenarcaniphilales bacterium]
MSVNVQDLSLLKEKYSELQSKLKHWSHKYYIENISEVEDAVYDAHLEELKALETEHPDLVEADSITKTIGSGVYQTSFTKTYHLEKMMSLDNAFGEEDIRDWENRINRIIGEETPREYVFELKIDGLSIALDYKNGKLYRAATRGNGKVGEDVTANLMTIKSLPKEIPLELLEKSDFSIRGEVYLPKEDFKKINAEREKEGLDLYANPRNTASGALRQLDPKITAARNLDAIFYNYFPYNNLGYAETEQVKSSSNSINEHFNSLEYLEKLGFHVNKEHNHLCKNIEEVISLYQEWQEKKDSLDFEIDGAVVKVNQLDLQKTLGETSKAPRWATALKFSAEEALTHVLSVDMEVGRTGAITPVANLEPVLLAGTTVKRATIHNFDQVDRLGVKVGDFVLVRKAGEIIPEIIKVDEAKRRQSVNGETIELVDVTRPGHCPVCGTALEQEDTILRCPNIVGCAAQIQRRIEHWASKKAMDIAGLGPAVVEQLLSEKLIKNPFDLYKLKFDDLAPLERMAEKSVNNLLAALEKSREIPFHRFLHALGIKHVGLNVSELIASVYPSLFELEKEVLGNHGVDLLKLDGLGEKILYSLKHFFESEIYVQVKRDYIDLGFDFKELVKRELSDKFAGMTFVITGTLSESRSYFEKIIKDNGGKVSSSVSKKTSYLLCGDDAGSKLTKAQDLGVEVLSEEKFREMV